MADTKSDILQSIANIAVILYLITQTFEVFPVAVRTGLTVAAIVTTTAFFTRDSSTRSSQPSHGATGA